MRAFHYQRKSHMTLLETLIAVSLLSVLLVFVFGFFRELSEITRMTEQKQKESFQMRYLESRLGFIFERIVHEDDKARKFFFYTQSGNRGISSSPSLILTFDNEVRLDPAFSGDVLARIYVDSDKRLCLAIWPLHVPEPYQYLQEEVLMDHVINVSYSFYAAPERVHDEKDITPKDPIDPEKKTPDKDEWHDDWAITYEQMPSIMKMVVKVAKDSHDVKSKGRESNEETVDFSLYFVLPSSKNYVYYPPGRLSA
jgi:hypothetical protein